MAQTYQPAHTALNMGARAMCANLESKAMSTTELTPIAMVPADHVALSIAEAFAVPKRSKEQKAAGLKIADVKAMSYAQAGANPALLAAYGSNRNANLKQAGAMSISAMVRGNQVHFASAIRNVCAAAGIAYTYSLEVLADGTQRATRADWVKLHAHITELKSAPDAKGAAIRRYAGALRMWADIQAHADTERARMEAERAALTVTPAPAPAPAPVAPVVDVVDPVASM